MKVIINGATGKMGQAVLALCRVGAYGVKSFSGVDVTGANRQFASALCDTVGKYDCLIDFSNRSATEEVLSYCLSRNTPAVIGTTGQTSEEMEKIAEASAAIPIFLSPNLSFGIAVLRRVCRLLSEWLPEAQIEIVETHRAGKTDAPSATAKMIAEDMIRLNPDSYPLYGRSGEGVRGMGEIGISSVRLGNCPGIHEVMFGTDTETVTVRHETHDRRIYAEGALRAAAFLCRRPAGLYSMEDLLG